MKKIFFKLYKFSNTWTGTIIIVLTFIFFIAQGFIIPSGSMKNTLLIGDMLFVKKFSYGIPAPTIPWVELPVTPYGYGNLIEGERPKRGDIVVFRFINDKSKYYVKRNIAVAGDRFFISDKDLYLRPYEGDAYIRKNYNKEDILEIENELWVLNPYKRKFTKINTYKNIFNMEGLGSNYYRYKDEPIAKDEFFMLGDNRDHSNDSRFWGTVKYKYVVGKPWFVFMSMEFRSYESLLSSNDIKDIRLLESKCPNIDIRTRTCKDLWEAYRFTIRWDRVGKSVSELEL